MILMVCFLTITVWQTRPFAQNDDAKKPSLYIFSNKERPVPSFDHTLHEEAFEDGGCAACHHVLDTDSNKLIYSEGEEAACSECHFDKKEKDVPAIREAFHESCTGCHRDRIRTKKNGGPTTCGQCHKE